MWSTARFGALSLIVFAIAGIAWFALELAPPLLGFEDTDDPSVSLQFLREHSDIYVLAGIVLILMAITLTVATFAVSDVAAPRSNSLALRSTSAFGLFSAAFFFAHGAVREGAGPLLYIDSLNHDWGQAAYLAVQMVGIHGFAQAAIFGLCTWAVGISLICLRSKAIPLALCALGALPAFRLMSALLGPLGVLPDGLWFLSMASIPGVMLWCLILGIVLLRKASTASRDRMPSGA